MCYHKPMAPEKRNLLVFQSHDSKSDFYLELAAYDWQLHIARSINEALDLMTRYTFYVGLCLVEDCHDEIFWEKIVQLFNRSPKIN